MARSSRGLGGLRGGMHSPWAVWHGRKVRESQALEGREAGGCGRGVATGCDDVHGGAKDGGVADNRNEHIRLGCKQTQLQDMSTIFSHL